MQDATQAEKRPSNYSLQQPGSRVTMTMELMQQHTIQKHCKEE